jgi:hypothetical protein
LCSVISLGGRHRWLLASAGSIKSVETLDEIYAVEEEDFDDAATLISTRTGSNTHALVHTHMQRGVGEGGREGGREERARLQRYARLISHVMSCRRRRRRAGISVRRSPEEDEALEEQVSRSCACIGSLCLRQRVHGVSTAPRAGGGGACRGESKMAT